MNMKRQTVFLGTMLLLASIAAAGQALRSGETAIYLKSGDLLVDRINDISSTRFVLETANNGEIPLRNIWMINFVNEKWNFPEERDQIETSDHYIFMKNGAVSSGRIVDFSSERRVFEFESGEQFPIGQVRRIYFAKRVPGSLAGQIQPQPKPQPQPQPQPQLQIFTGVYERREPRPGIILDLREDGTARMEVATVANLPPFVMNGRWETSDPEHVTVLLESSIGGLEQRVYTFIREADVLVGTGEVSRQYGDMRLRRR